MSPDPTQAEPSESTQPVPVVSAPEATTGQVRAVSRKDLHEPKPVTGAQRAIGATLGRPRPRGKAAALLVCLVVAAVILIPLGVFKVAGRPEPVTSTPTAVPDRTLSASAPLDSLMEVAGRIGSVPVVSLKGHLGAPTHVLRDVVVRGTGHVVHDGDGVALSVATFSGTDGSVTTGTASGRRIFRGSLTAQAVGKDLADALDGVGEDSRVVLRSPVASSDGTPGTQITVVDVLCTRAHGQDVSGQVDTSAVPTVTVDDSDAGDVSVATTDLPAPTTGTTTVLVQGEGEQVRAGDTLLTRSAVFSWDGTQRSSTYPWEAVPGVIDLSAAMTGLAQRLVDVQVGSRVLVTLPADQARGDGALVVVVDVVAVLNPADLSDPGLATSPASPTPSPASVRVTPSARSTGS